MKAASGGEEAHQIMPSFQPAAARFNGEAARLVQIAPTRDKDVIAAQYKILDEAYQALTKETGIVRVGTTPMETTTTKTTPTKTTTTGTTPSEPKKPAPPTNK
jgi:hypothetical protein